MRHLERSEQYVYKIKGYESNYKLLKMAERFTESTV